jgi:hypothetical protein
MILFPLLAGCSAICPAPNPRVVTVNVEKPRPDCQPTPVAVPVPPKPRTFEAVVAWAEETEKRRQETAAALDKCRGER